MNLKLENIFFAYNGDYVLSNVSTTIQDGDFIALVGPNGSGKSTFIKCLNKILSPQKGIVFLENKNIARISYKDLAKKMAYVPQKEQSHLSLTVFDYILTGRKPYIHWKPGASDLKKVAEIISTFQIDDIAMKDINKISGGQYQMISIARAIAQEPRILLLDEPTANLDIKHQIEIMELLKTLSKNGISIIITLHDINTAIRYANKFIMLKNKSVFIEGGKEIMTKKNIEELYTIKVNVVQQPDGLFVIPSGLF